MKRIWPQLPLWIRIFVIALILGTSVRPPFSPLALWLCWGGLVIILFIVGAIKLRLLPLIYLAMTFLSMGWILILLVAFRRPINDATGFWAHYPEFMMCLLGGYLITSSVRIEEWVSVFSKIPRVGVPFAAILIAFPTAVASAFSSIRRAVEARNLSRPRSWYNPDKKETRVVYQLDNFEVRTTIFAETALQLIFLIKNWRQTVTMATAQKKKYELLNLNDIYEIDSFPLIYEAIFGNRPITDEWESLVTRHVSPGKSVLDIGAGSGKLSIFVGRIGAYVDAVESNPYFVELLRRQTTEELAANHVSVYQERFPKSYRSVTYDVAILHQNVMLELINEIGAEGTWKALRKITSPGGVILFDYPVHIRTPKVGQRITLVDNTLPNFGHVEYGYVYEGFVDGYHHANISLTTIIAATTSTRSVNMKGVAPQVSDLLAVGQKFGFNIEQTLPTQAYTFFPSDMNVYALRLTNGG